MPRAANRTDKQSAIHLAEALRLLKRALELDPDNGLYELGRACVYEDGQVADSRADWREQAIDRYLAAYRKSMVEDERLSRTPLGGFEALVSYEAGVSYLRLIKKRGMTDSEADAARLIEKHIAALERLPTMISPIVLSLRTGAVLKDLLAPAARISFNLDGTGRAQSYPWLRPETAFLVWDPDGDGRVTSGRQLFGNVTWWMFWESGYQALAALDDDHDGWLQGRELAGLALWFDRNQNGISDPGEVIPIEQAGVEALAACADGWDGRSPMNSGGVRLKDGRVLPTWDWIATRLAPP